MTLNATLAIRPPRLALPPIIRTLLFSMVFTALFMLVGWKELSPDAFPDLNNYRAGFESGWFFFTTLNQGPLEFLVSESTWVRLFTALYEYVGDIAVAFDIITIVSVFLTSIYIISSTKSFWYLLFLINPAYVDMAVGQLRSGLATGIFFLALTTKSKTTKIALLVLSSSIHTSFILFSLVYAAYEWVSNRNLGIAILSRKVFTVFLVVVITLLVAFYREVALALIQDERAYEYWIIYSGIFLSFAWVTFVPTFLMLRRSGSASFELVFFSFCVFMMLFSTLLGDYGSRFSSIGIPALAVLSSTLSPKLRWLFIAQYAVFTAAYFYFWR